MKKIGLIDYKAGNIKSLTNAFEYLGYFVKLVRSESDFENITHLVLPGVGAFGHCAEMLKKSGLEKALTKWVLIEEKPVLGVCVGMQLMAHCSYEQGYHQGLGWLTGEVQKIMPLPKLEYRVPHVGWNDVLFQSRFGEYQVGDSADFYFDHSFAFQNYLKSEALGTCNHNGIFLAAAMSKNIVATQFHPEKSQAAGLKFLRSFVNTKYD